MSDLTGNIRIGIVARVFPEDTFDADYGQVLERFYCKGLASPAGVEPASPP